MSHSAYAPPQADLRTDAEGLGSGDFEIGRCLSEAWSDTWANLGLWLGVMLVSGLAAALSVLTVVGIVLIVPVLMWGTTRFFLGMRDGDATFDDAFSGFSCYGTALGGMLLFFLAYVLVGVPGQMLQQIGVQGNLPLVQLIGSLVSLATSLLVTPRLMFTPLLMVDRGLSAPDALRASWESTERVKWKLIGLLVVNVLVILGGLVALLVGVIPAAIMGYLMIVSAYRQVTGPAPARAA